MSTEPTLQARLAQWLWSNLDPSRMVEYFLICKGNTYFRNTYFIGTRIKHGLARGHFRNGF